MTDVFLRRFPEEKALMDLVKRRADGFVEYTSHVEENVSSITPKAAETMYRINMLGFITIDSQEGIITETPNPQRNGKPVLNKRGIPATLYRYAELAYCVGFIRTELVPAFTRQVKACNPDIRIVTSPNKGYIPLTSNYYEYKDGTYIRSLGSTHVPELTIKEVDTDIIPDLRKSGYYKGPILPPFPISMDTWSFITIYDTKWARHALDTNGLFTCIERALNESLTESGSRKRRRATRRRRRSYRV